LAVINGYNINGLGGYFIGEYWWLIMGIILTDLVDILLVDIGAY
jgi:hypothetical protein